MEAGDDEMWSRNFRTPIVNNFSEISGATFTLDRDNKEIDFLHHLLPTSLVNKIVIETNAYAQRCIAVSPDKFWTPNSFPEMLAFLGIHVVFSIIGLPTYTLAWKSAWPLEFPSIPSIMTRTRFERISKYFYLNDTSNNPPRGRLGHDKLCHIRPVIEKVAETCSTNYDQRNNQ